jgi:hypothetical protein
MIMKSRVGTDLLGNYWYLIEGIFLEFNWTDWERGNARCSIPDNQLSKGNWNKESHGHPELRRELVRSMVHNLEVPGLNICMCSISYHLKFMYLYLVQPGELLKAILK